MKREWGWKNISWKSKKRIAEMLCVFVVACSMVLSLCVQNQNSIQPEESKAAGSYRMENDGRTVSLKLDSRSVDERGTTIAAESSEEESDAKQEMAAQASEKQAVEPAEADPVEGKDVSKKQSEAAQVGVQDIDIAKNSKQDATKNKVVQNNMTQSGNRKNVVVKNPAPLTLVSTIFENHGQIPKLGEAEIKYQYPVEIGYAADKNYDGKQNGKDSILNIVMDTVPEAEDKEDTEAADLEDEDTEEDSEQATSEHPKKDEHTEEDSEQVTSEHPEEDGDTKEDSEQNTSEHPEEEDGQPEEGGHPTESEAAGDDIEKKEQDEREEFKTEIWKKLLMTEPVEVKKEEKLKVDQEKTLQKSSESEDSSSEAVTEETEKKEKGETIAKKEQADGEVSSDSKEEKKSVDMVEADAGYYVISGRMRDGKDAFVSDIVIKPSGVKGFNKVRFGKDGEFVSSIRITEDAVNKDVELYFTDGERITKGTTFTYTKDTHIPKLMAAEENIKTFSSGQDSIYCTNNPEVGLKIEDGEKETSSGIEKISCVYGDKIACVVDSFEEPVVTLPQDFFGRVLLNCEDKAGNTSDIISQYYLVEQNAPEITFSDSEVCTVPYTLWIDAEDTGHIISGIDNIECIINGETYEIADLTARENVQLADDLEVPSKVGFSIPFEQEGSYQIELRVTDHAGNVATVKKDIEVTQPDMVAVYMPKEFTIHIDPQQLLGREQIFSDDITLDNVSNVDVMVRIEDIAVQVNDEVSDTGVLKDCELYIVAPDTGEKIKLKKGKNKNIYSYCLPMNAKGDITNLHFVGETTEGSDVMWKSSDISIDVRLSFGKRQE